MVKIRMTRLGRHKLPYFRIVAVDSRQKRDGDYIALIGTYEPFSGKVDIKEDVAMKFLMDGAQPSDTVKSFLKDNGIWKKFTDEKLLAKNPSAKVKKAQPKKEVKKAEPKKEVKKAEPKPVVERKVSEEALKREKEQLKVVETKPAEKGPTGKAAPIAEAEKTSIIMISISPAETETFLNDETKNVLFYKVTPVNEVKRVLIYSTSPVKGVVGEFDLDTIDIKAPSTIWGKYSSKSVITKKEFDEYFSGKDKAHALISKTAFWYSKPKPLSDFNMQKGPSGFQYLK